MRKKRKSPRSSSVKASLTTWHGCDYVMRLDSRPGVQHMVVLVDTFSVLFVYLYKYKRIYISASYIRVHIYMHIVKRFHKDNSIIRKPYGCNFDIGSVYMFTTMRIPNGR